MRINSVFKRKYLSSQDIGNKQLLLTIADTSMEPFGKESKCVVHFKEISESLPLNSTNAKTIAEFYGPETDDWIGQRIVLYVADVTFKGQPTQGIRIQKPKPESVVGPPRIKS